MARWCLDAKRPGRRTACSPRSDPAQVAAAPGDLLVDTAALFETRREVRAEGIEARREDQREAIGHCGPGEISEAHRANESLSISEAIACERFLDALATA